ncbi:MAG: hypothetical protein IJC39_01335 [Firmicutes bacterium]|nr:hypothetical protein [Bacillota bacterium]
MNGKSTAAYKVITDSGGICFQFFCELSGARLCTTKPIQADTPEKALETAWETEGRYKFNRCEKCGKWISDAMFNVDVHECVECAPWENYPLYCPQCGKRIFDVGKICPKCGASLRYEGR